MGRRLRAGSRLFVVYAVASLVPVAVLGAVLLHGYQDQGNARGRAQGQAQAAVIEEMAIAPALSGADLSKGLNDAERARLRAATDLAIFNGSVARLRLRSFSGAVSFSDDGSLDGGVPVDDRAFQRAASGHTDVRLVEDSRQAAGVTVRVLQPIVAAASGQATGVLEVYLPYEQIAKSVQADTRRTIWRVGAGLVVLYGVLALISWWTTRALRRNAAAHEHQALHDTLTGLPNREFFRRSAESALAKGRRGDGGALVLMDLDHFKEVNDTLGHHAGDELLRVVAERLRDLLRTDDTVARLGGDEFGLVLPGNVDREQTVALLGRLREQLAREIVLGSVSLHVVASFGVCFYPDDADNLEALLQHADSAMYQGKHGPTGVVVYEPDAGSHPTHSLVVQAELRQALERDELVLYYQPKYELESGEVHGVEALVRWQHPERGLLPPSEFLPVAERSELIEPLTNWVLRRALKDLSEWTARGFDWTVAVNVSARNLSSLDFARTVASLVAEAGAPTDRLHLEVTETALAFDADAAAEVVEALAWQGLSISVDDFGIGYTSLSQLRSLAVSEVKIDRTFVAGLSDSAQDRAIVGSVIGLGHSLGFKVTAEGVETQDVADWLADAGCDRAQGYLWMRPAPWTDVADALTPRNPEDLAAVSPAGTEQRTGR
ncbi:putative bifunctional diguanylate cyclase/phosphodiesterase [Angustibacter sp. McL0619]|uniref:putative bifunctional diguanylate cyclase/phosphodiesterase n=1 Tax=Angustibacter sp. McL0619 TaxID=3415676 RepID=UPI003CF1363A